MSKIPLSKQERSGTLASDRTLRIITILTFIPALPLLISYGVISREVCPALGLVPLFFSASFGLVHSCKTIESRTLDKSIDSFIAFFLLSILIPGWIAIAEDVRYWSGHVALLGAYGTMPLMLNMCIHAYFGTRDYVAERFRHYKSLVIPPCPHCAGLSRTNWRKATRDGSIRTSASEQRFSDEAENIMAAGDDAASIESGSNVTTPRAGPLFKPPPEDYDDDSTVIV